MILSAKQDAVMVENKIQKLLLDLDERLAPEVRIDHVEVDARSFANMKTEIYFRYHSTKVPRK